MGRIAGVATIGTINRIMIGRIGGEVGYEGREG